MMKRRIRKGNALVLTTVILFAVSIIAAGLTMYFYYANIQSNNSNVYSQKHVELENEFNSKYIYVLSGESVQMRDDESPINISDVIKLQVTETQSQHFTLGDYRTSIVFVDDTAGVKTVSYEIETAYKRKEYHLKKFIKLNGEVFSVDKKEVYYVQSINS